MHISSLQNPKVKQVVALQQKAKLRKEEGLFVVEGQREVERAAQSGFQIEELWHSKDDDLVAELASSANETYACSESVFEKISYRASTSKVLAICKMKHYSLASLTLNEKPLIVVLEGIEKPGNLGAILRTCNAFGADALLCCDSALEIHNPNVIRNSLGAFFDIPVISTTSKEAISFFKDNDIKIYTAYIGDARPYTETDYNQPIAVTFGSEAHGLTDDWVLNTSSNIIIPMKGIIDSLNLSVSVGVVLAEVERQRSLA